MKLFAFRESSVRLNSNIRQILYNSFEAMILWDFFTTDTYNEKEQKFLQFSLSLYWD